MVIAKRIDPSDGVAYSFKDFMRFYNSGFSSSEVRAYWENCKPDQERHHQPPCRKATRCWRPRQRATPALIDWPKLSDSLPPLPDSQSGYVVDGPRNDSGLLRYPAANCVKEPGALLKLLKTSRVNKRQLDAAMQTAQTLAFRWWAGRNTFDFKLQGAATMRLAAPEHEALNPVLAALVALARLSLPDDQELAILQLLLNYYEDSSNSVRPHRHPCRQVCASLGAPRIVEVEGRPVEMVHGDCLVLAGQMHSVPPVKKQAGPRLSICLFYATAEDCLQRSASVQSNGDFWWTHPDDADGPW